MEKKLAARLCEPSSASKYTGNDSQICSGIEVKSVVVVALKTALCREGLSVAELRRRAFLASHASLNIP
ncbi:MAG: hypothetical protein IID58_03215 [Proteobacteria bacterium]|nr:hypothetical protein [Pseudomonadota bacterium]